MAKLLLNSLWGKLAQSPDKKKVDIIHTYDSYWNKITDDGARILSEIMINDNTLVLQWKDKQENLSYGPNTSLAVAAFVTSYARLVLYEKMEEVEKIRLGSLLYFDTDSLVYYCKKTDRQLECGDHLGQLKDEIEADYGHGAFMKAFVSCGPKNYAYTVQLPSGEVKSCIKTKGITLNKATLKLINYEFMFKAAKAYSRKDDMQQCVKVPQFNIKSDSYHNVQTKYFSKSYNVVSEKRIVSHNSTFPYGFKGDRTTYCSIPE